VIERDEPRPDWDMNKAQGGAWSSESRTPTAVDKIRDAAREAGEKARRVFGK
jgi:hypothetical protein